MSEMTTAAEFAAQAAVAGTWEHAASWAAEELIETSSPTLLCTPQARPMKQRVEAGDYAMVFSSALRCLGRLGWDVADPGEFTDWYVLPLLADKQHDYGHDNIELSGIDGVNLRIVDKWCHYENLTKRAKESPDAEGDGAIHESLSDTLLDIVGYCIIAVMLGQGTFSRPLGRDTADGVGGGRDLNFCINWAGCQADQHGDRCPESEWCCAMHEASRRAPAMSVECGPFEFRRSDGAPPEATASAPQLAGWDSAVLGAAEKALGAARRRHEGGEEIARDRVVAFEDEDGLVAVWLRLDVAP